MTTFKGKSLSDSTASVTVNHEHKTLTVIIDDNHYDPIHFTEYDQWHSLYLNNEDAELDIHLDYTDIISITIYATYQIEGEVDARTEIENALYPTITEVGDWPLELLTSVSNPFSMKALNKNEFDKTVKALFKPKAISELNLSDEVSDILANKKIEEMSEDEFILLVEDLGDQVLHLAKYAILPDNLAQIAFDTDYLYARESLDQFHSSSDMFNNIMKEVTESEDSTYSAQLLHRRDLTAEQRKIIVRDALVDDKEGTLSKLKELSGFFIDKYWLIGLND